METVAEGLELMERHVARAMTAAAGDAGCSPVLRAVIGELERKLVKTRVSFAAGAAMREPIIELEQAADSARVAAQADTGAAAATRDLVDIAHYAICVLKVGMGPTPA